MKNRNKNINIPNGLSILRILLIIPFVYYFMRNELVPAGIVLILSGLSDMLDGMIARKFNQFTELGQMLDPLSDKLTQGAVAVCLAIEQPVLIPLLGIFVLKEVLMVVAACLLIKKKKRPTGSRWYGKVATVLFYISFAVIVAMKIWNMENLTVTIVLLSITAAFMIYAFIQYFKIYLSILHSDDPKDAIDFNEVMDKKAFRK
ncbi:CDP-alcohol phosphatidyltransferase family protein [Caproiciproducens galactitolivorans]|uniref:CDP-diacylglycerol--glycerol-3-phosphate 3-phosphatidyltransferase n=1 Tax=Caproiciproducens galactitolivorans TaxID=642589 RepID=A0ABT4BSF1_9FIRM|nr:CDP-alcohol phosphatidyltransferase family protein [Caproiciproducens galactitolivorans]MCY1713774.1 CDP-alcohol phosphatidyltransferase family protein [Caproiciproducens galactitolivorans]